MTADIRANLTAVRERIARACLRAARSPDEVTLVAVTKTVPEESIRLAYDLGVRDFGENRVQEAEGKSAFFSALQPRPRLHMIGHLQSNKVRTALGIFDFIHSVDSVKLAQTLARQAERPIPVLLEVNVAAEASKTGLAVAEVAPALAEITKLANLDVRGLMTVAPLADDPEAVRPVFHKLRELREAYGLQQLSMGMTDDFEVAIEEGATMIRLGRAIFGERH